MNVENAQRSFDRTKVLFDQAAISKVDMENAETILKNAKNDLDLTKATINTSQIDLQNLKDSLANTTIIAPISGVMDEKSVDLGQYANLGATLGKVKNISPIYAVIKVDQNDRSFFELGQSAKVKVGANDVNEYDGIIKTMEVSADTTSRVFECKVQVDNQDQSLKPGIYANVDIVGNQKEEMVAVPTDALSGTQGDYTVFVNDNGIVRKHIVSIGEITKGLVEIKNGIQKGDSVIISNLNTLQDGDAVSVVKE
jgi:RND family efflux transporter MFP subunit